MTAILAGANVADELTELTELTELIEYRPGVLTEALEQVNDIISYFRGTLSFTRASHPWTYGLARIALHVGEFQVMHYKAVSNRPRPSRLCPALMPPIELPGHASYPSGHSTQSHLIALCLAQVMPSAANLALDPTTGLPVLDAGGQPDPKWGPLQRVAERISRNREVLGLHYPSDSAAGVELARASFPLLESCTTVQTIIDYARQEWQ